MGLGFYPSSNFHISRDILNTRSNLIITSVLVVSDFLTIVQALPYIALNLGTQLSMRRVHPHTTTHIGTLIRPTMIHGQCLGRILGIIGEILSN